MADTESTIYFQLLTSFLKIGVHTENVLTFAPRTFRFGCIAVMGTNALNLMDSIFNPGGMDFLGSGVVAAVCFEKGLKLCPRNLCFSLRQRMLALPFLH